MKTAILFLIFFPFSSQAFNPKECRKNFEKSAIWTSSVFTTTYNSSEFTSSTGNCSSLKESETQKGAFFIKNLNEIRKDSAKGYGEYLLAYSKLAGCNSDEGALFMSSTQQNYENLFVKSREPHAIYLGLDSILNEVCR
ncbi:MAG: hypothetical protein ACJAT2_002747 [Bacteriovoracaceae bacterium]|jgi:hypothetical protein